MEKETEDLLKNIRANPSSGMSHDAKITFVQVEEVFAIDKLTTEIISLKDNLAKYSITSERESRAMRYLTIALGVVAIFQLFIAYGQFRLGETQIEASQEQTSLQNGIWEYERMRNDRIEARDVQWRREDLQAQGRLP